MSRLDYRALFLYWIYIKMIFQYLPILFQAVLWLHCLMVVNLPSHINQQKFGSRYQNDLPKKIKSRGKDAHLTHEEMVQTIKWKLAVSKG